MRDPARRDIASVLLGRGTGSLRGLLVRLVLGVALAMTALVVAAIWGTVAVTSKYRDDQVAAVAREVAADRILVDLLNAETGVSGFTLTGRRSYLQPYVRAKASYPKSIRGLMAQVRGEPPLEEAARSVDRTARLWFDEARTLVSLRQSGQVAAAVQRVNQGIAKARLDATRAEQAVLLRRVDNLRRESLEAADRRRAITLLAISGAALLTVLVVGWALQQLWRRVGEPTAALAQGVRRVTAGRMTEPVPETREGVRELAQLVTAFNEMQRQVVAERESSVESARREEARRAEQRLWRTVEQGLLPDRLPVVAGLRLSARYQPAVAGLLIGGDFYDARVLPDGSLAVMVGDVAGHGAESAARAARLRFGWRTLVDVDPDPERVLSVLNAQISSPGERVAGVFASMCHAIISPDGHTRLALAGHPRPILVDDEMAGLISVSGRGPVLGLLDSGRWPVTELWMPERATLVLYTDGLTEARRGGELFGVPRACKVLDDERRTPLELRLAALVAAARRYDEGGLRDDVVVLGVQRVAEP